MDLSEKYVKMCREAKEIQEMWEPQVGDWIKFYDEIMFLIRKSEIDGYRQVSIWLPRQDQLLEIWRKHDEILKQMKELTPIDMHYTFSSIVDFLEKHFWSQRYVSFEQTILAFVMYDLYGKIWDEQKEEWIKEKEDNHEKAT